MIKNRTAQLIFQTIYCTLGLDKLGKKKVQKV